MTRFLEVSGNSVPPQTKKQKKNYSVKSETDGNLICWYLKNPDSRIAVKLQLVSAGASKKQMGITAELGLS